MNKTKQDDGRWLDSNADLRRRQKDWPGRQEGDAAGSPTTDQFYVKGRKGLDGLTVIRHSLRRAGRFHRPGASGSFSPRPICVSTISFASTSFLQLGDRHGHHRGCGCWTSWHRRRLSRWLSYVLAAMVLLAMVLEVRPASRRGGRYMVCDCWAGCAHRQKLRGSPLPAGHRHHCGHCAGVGRRPGARLQRRPDCQRCAQSAQRRCAAAELKGRAAYPAVLDGVDTKVDSIHASIRNMEAALAKDPHEAFDGGGLSFLKKRVEGKRCLHFCAGPARGSNRPAPVVHGPRIRHPRAGAWRPALHSP